VHPHGPIQVLRIGAAGSKFLKILFPGYMPIALRLKAFEKPASDWSVHFIGPDGKTRVGPWLLLDSHEEERAILCWGNITDEGLAEPD
jgi:hypothetical protein